MLVGIQEELLRLHSLQLLGKLLQDKTTKGNIIWATDAYQEYGPDYEKDREIKVHLITVINPGIIKKRVHRASEQQAQRTRHHAEVSTPLWLCNLMNEYADNVWFSDGEFDGGLDTRMNWSLVPEAVPKYINSRRLEITCGEAPFLVQRYDSSTGKILPLTERQGLLDRKMKWVNACYADDEEKWMHWCLRAFQSIYGYEYQGDSLLIARLNMVMSFEDYMKAAFQRRPTKREFEKIINVVTWNLMQMDGITYQIPCCKVVEAVSEASLFDEHATESIIPRTTFPYVKTYNWRRGNSIEMRHVNKGGQRDMKFDFVIGNPPFQEESSETSSKSNGQKPMTNIFHHFQIEADKLANRGCVLVYPCGRWFHQSGKGVKNFGKEQINDKRLAKVICYGDAKKVFPDVDIADGVSIVIKNMNKTSPGFIYTYLDKGIDITVDYENPGDDLLPIDPRNYTIIQKIDKFVEKYNLDYLHEYIWPRTLFGIESNFVENNPDKVRLYNGGGTYDLNKEIKLFANDKAGKSGRTKWFVTDKDNIRKGREHINKWKVVVSSANAGGQKRDNQLEVLDTHSVFGRSRLALALFNTKEEAENFYKYVQSFIIRFAFLMTDEALSSLGKRVPQLKSYNNNSLLDFSKSIDGQLKEKMKISDSEMEYLIQYVKGVRNGNA